MHGGLSATVRIGAIPTAVPATPLLTVALTDRHPQARTRIEVLSSQEIQRSLNEFELDGGLTYLDGDDAVEQQHALPLYQERYLLLMDAGQAADRTEVGWSDVAARPVCALTRSMQNRRIIDAALAAHGLSMDVVVETDTVAALYAHAATRRWPVVIAHTWLHAFGTPDGMRALPIRGDGPRPWVGLVVGDHGPTSHVAQELLDSVGGVDVAATLDRSAQGC